MPDRNETDVVWYDTRRGVLLGTLLAFSTLFAILISIETLNPLVNYFPPLVVTVPIDVYLFGFLGAASYALLRFSAGWPQDDDSKKIETNGSKEIETKSIGIFNLESKELKKFTSRLVAALCLSTGIFLAGASISGLIPVIDSAPPTLAVAGTAFLVGFFVDRAYHTLGTIASRLTNPENRWMINGNEVLGFRTTKDKSDLAWTVFLIFLSVFSIFFTIFLTVDWGQEGPPFLLPSASAFPTTVIPFEVYLYGFIGSMGYIFMNLFEKFDRSYRSMCEHILRAPLGPLLAVGFFLVTDFLLIGGDAASTESIRGIISGFSFLIGLYPDVAIASLNAVADRIFTDNTEEDANNQNYDFDTLIEEFKKISSFLQSGYQTSFKVLDRSLSAAEESARVTVEDGRVTVTGTIVGNDGCYTARLDGVTIEEGTLVVRVESFDNADEGEACTDALIGIGYEAIIEFNREPPASVRIEYNGDPVATEMEYPMNPLVFGRWLHAHEEDSNGIETYRPADHSFPPARGRKGFEIHEDGRFVELAIAPGDGTLEHQGQWSNEEGRGLDVRLENGTSYVLEIVNIEKGSLKVRRK